MSRNFAKTFLSSSTSTMFAGYELIDPRPMVRRSGKTIRSSFDYSVPGTRLLWFRPESSGCPNQWYRYIANLLLSNIRFREFRLHRSLYTAYYAAHIHTDTVIVSTRFGIRFRPIVQRCFIVVPFIIVRRRSRCCNFATWSRSREFGLGRRWKYFTR